MENTITEERLRFNDYSSYLKNTFGTKVQKISINTGYSCPNRDGTKAYHGCTYCNITSIQPEYTRRYMSVSTQLEQGIAFFKRKNKRSKYLAYFQSYTNTYRELDKLKQDYEEALAYPGVVGIVIGTRPDCVPIELADYLQTLARTHYVAVEIGIESTDDVTLQRVNRCHNYSDVITCFDRLKNRRIQLGGHLIIGFPWETKDTLYQHAARISTLPIDFIKLHHLQILRHTRLAREFEKERYSLLDFDTYIQFAINFVEESRPDLIFQRFLAEAPKELLIAPNYGMRNVEFSQVLNRKMIALNTWQGRKYGASAM